MKTPLVLVGSVLRLVLLLSITLGFSACGRPTSQRPAYSDFDAELLAIMRERTRLWYLPKAEGGVREYDISNIVCPIVTAEKLGELGIANSSNVRFEPDAGFPPGSQSWHIKGDLVDALTVSTLGVWLGPGDRCEAQFRHTL